MTEYLNYQRRVLFCLACILLLPVWACTDVLTAITFALPIVLSWWVYRYALYTTVKSGDHRIAVFNRCYLTAVFTVGLALISAYFVTTLTCCVWVNVGGALLLPVLLRLKWKHVFTHCSEMADGKLCTSGRVAVDVFSAMFSIAVLGGDLVVAQWAIVVIGMFIGKRFIRKLDQANVVRAFGVCLVVVTLLNYFLIAWR